jgi:polyisoprenoid-binding protein YceI
MSNKDLKPAVKVNRLSNFSQFKMSFTSLLLMLFAFSISVSATEYVVDNSTSKVKWEAKKVTGKHIGSISFANGSVSVTGNKISGGTFVIDMKSLVDEDISDAGMKAKLMGHLASDDFFSIEKFPESKMVIKKATLIAGDDYHFLADLTIKGITQPIEFDAKSSVTGDKLNAEGVITVNRTLFGIKYGSGSFFEGLGDKVIYDDFTLTFNVVAQKK